MVTQQQTLTKNFLKVLLCMRVHGEERNVIIRW
jgi:hypothetical protein